MDLIPVIGLEIHAELQTESKMFCSCPNKALALEKNLYTCPVCLGHPGTLPVPNSRAIELGIMAGLALNCSINSRSKFDRKNYFYPDLPKGYQISQYDLPIAHDGFVEIKNTRVGIERAHLEEDTAKLTHLADGWTNIDYNRAGVPLLEIVSLPEITSAVMAKDYAKEIQKILRYIGVSQADMEKGLFRCEANVSLQRPGSFRIVGSRVEGENLNNKVEVKNINSFRSLERAINFEISRQKAIIKKGGQVLAETRGVDDKSGETFSQRIKESSADYRYFPEPDIPPLFFSDHQLRELKKALPELPAQKFQRFKEQYGLVEDLAWQLSGEKDLADWFEKAVVEASQLQDFENIKNDIYRSLANLLLGEIKYLINQNKTSLENLKITPESLASLVFLFEKGKINSSGVQKVLGQMFIQGGEPERIIAELSLGLLEDKEEIKKIISEIIKNHPQQVAEYKKGKLNLIQFFIGKLMTASGGQVNPETAKQELENILNI